VSHTSGGCRTTLSLTPDVCKCTAIIKRTHPTCGWRSVNHHLLTNFDDVVAALGVLACLSWSLTTHSNVTFRRNNHHRCIQAQDPWGQVDILVHQEGWCRAKVSCPANFTFWVVKSPFCRWRWPFHSVASAAIDDRCSRIICVESTLNVRTKCEETLWALCQVKSYLTTKQKTADGTTDDSGRMHFNQSLSTPCAFCIIPRHNCLLCQILCTLISWVT
jgi:hypothetical protein